MNQKQIINIVLLHILIFIVGSMFFILSFRSPFFQSVKVFFYRGIAILIAETLVLLGLLTLLKKRGGLKIFTWRDVMLSALLLFSVNIVFFTHLPVTAERSLTVFLLGYMDEYNDEFLTENEITNIFVDKYVYGNNNIGKRLDEQVVSGNLSQVKENSSDVYKITSQGRSLMSFYRLMSRLFGIDQKNVSP